MPKVETVQSYKCSDGELFTDEKKAMRHESVIEIDDHFDFVRHGRLFAETAVTHGKYLLDKLAEMNAAGLLEPDEEE